VGVAASGGAHESVFLFLTSSILTLPSLSDLADLRAKFEPHGAVTAVRFAPRGVAFVALDGEGAVDAAIAALDGAAWGGRTMLVERARTVLEPRAAG
jgi:hypothetical protein